MERSAAVVERVLEAVLRLQTRLQRGSLIANDLGDLLSWLAFVGSARGLALFRTTSDGFVLAGHYGLPLSYSANLGGQRTLDGLPGDLRAAIEVDQPVEIADLAHDPRTITLAYLAPQAQLVSSLAVPLRVDGVLVGMLHAFFVRGADPARRRWLQALCSALACAMAGPNSSVRASIAGLYTAVEIRKQLTHVHAIGQRHQRPYGVALYALDGHAQLKETFGPELVRQAIERLGGLLVSECRDSDRAGLLGESTCLVVCPEADQRGVFVQCQRVLSAFSEQVFVVDEARVQLSASAGISCFPDNEAERGDDAIRAATEAIRRALDGGRQCLVAVAAAGAAGPGKVRPVTK